MNVEKQKTGEDTKNQTEKLIKHIANKISSLKERLKLKSTIFHEKMT